MAHSTLKRQSLVVVLSLAKSTTSNSHLQSHDDEWELRGAGIPSWRVALQSLLRPGAQLFHATQVVFPRKFALQRHKKGIFLGLCASSVCTRPLYKDVTRNTGVITPPEKAVTRNTGVITPPQKAVTRNT